MPLTQTEKEDKRKLCQAAYQHPRSFFNFLKVIIDSLRICQRHRTYTYKGRTEIPLSKLTNKKQKKF
jgi:hypothetical protein